MLCGLIILYWKLEKVWTGAKKVLRCHRIGGRHSTLSASTFFYKSQKHIRSWDLSWTLTPNTFIGNSKTNHNKKKKTKEKQNYRHAYAQYWLKIYISYLISFFFSFSMALPPFRGFYHYKKMVSSRYFPFFPHTFVVIFQMQQNV